MATTMPDGYRSATKYHFNEEQVDAIIRTTAYHRRDFDLAVLWFSPREHAHIRPSIATPFQRTSNAGLGPLDQLPPELLHDMLLHLDMQSLFKFRQLSLASRQLVDSLNQYQMVVSHGLNLFCALLRTKLANDISLSDFYTALCTKTCSICGEFAGFISFLIWKRCCIKCIQEARETEVQPRASVWGWFNLVKEEVSELKSFKTIPGIYTLREAVSKLRISVVSSHRAYLISPVRRLGFPQRENIRSHRKFNFMASCALPYYNRRTGEVERGVSCAGCQLAIEKDIVGIENWPYEARDKVYAPDGFLEHFRWCKQAQILWESSDGGNMEPAELPEAVRRSIVRID